MAAQTLVSCRTRAKGSTSHSSKSESCVSPSLHICCYNSTENYYFKALPSDLRQVYTKKETTKAKDVEKISRVVSPLPKDEHREIVTGMAESMMPKKQIVCA